MLAELRRPNEATRPIAARRLGQVGYDDPTVIAVLQAAGASGSGELRKAIAETLRRYGEKPS